MCACAWPLTHKGDMCTSGLVFAPGQTVSTGDFPGRPASFVMKKSLLKSKEKPCGWAGVGVCGGVYVCNMDNIVKFSEPGLNLAFCNYLLDTTDILVRSFLEGKRVTLMHCGKV